MKRLLPLFALLLAGCIQVDIAISVKPDGSGTITQTTIVTPYLEEMMGQMMGSMFGGTGKTTKTKSSGGKISGADKESAEKIAKNLGEDVTWVSSKPIKTKQGEGTVAIYRFKDIRKLKGIQQNPIASAGLQKKDGDLAQIHFERKDGISYLLLIPPKDTLKADTTAPAEPDSVATDTGSAMGIPMAQLNPFRGMRSKITLKVEGKLLQTNATVRTGNTITVLDLDMDKLLAMVNDTAFAKKFQGTPQSVTEARTRLSGVPGFVADLNDTLRVEFQ